MIAGLCSDVVGCLIAAAVVFVVQVCVDESWRDRWH